MYIFSKISILLIKTLNNVLIIYKYFQLTLITIDLYIIYISFDLLIQ